MRIKAGQTVFLVDTVEQLRVEASVLAVAGSEAEPYLMVRLEEEEEAVPLILRSEISEYPIQDSSGELLGYGFEPETDEEWTQFENL